MATVLERAAHSVYRMFFLYFDIVILAIFHFGFAGETLVLIASVIGHCLTVCLSGSILILCRYVTVCTDLIGCE